MPSAFPQRPQVILVQDAASISYFTGATQQPCQCTDGETASRAILTSRTPRTSARLKLQYVLLPHIGPLQLASALLFYLAPVHSLITRQFEGILNITFTEHGLPYDQANVPLFSSTQTAFVSGNGGVPRNTYEFSFPTTIPSSSAVLPPTWHIHHPGAEADVLYQVRFAYPLLCIVTYVSLLTRCE